MKTILQIYKLLSLSLDVYQNTGTMLLTEISVDCFTPVQHKLELGIRKLLLEGQGCEELAKNFLNQSLESFSLYRSHAESLFISIDCYRF